MDPNDCAFQLIERTVLDHPHHTLFIILALANATKDQELLQGKVSKKAGGRLSRGMSQTAAEEVSTSFTDYSHPCWVLRSGHTYRQMTHQRDSLKL